MDVNEKTKKSASLAMKITGLVQGMRLTVSFIKLFDYTTF